ncbi:hypothetical protein J6590_088562 [Homalodisca vitripennis]|nr:hypothetical protein J6590_088562 [Homalodisca vitripennis]
MTVVVNDESKHSTFSRINIVICFIPCGSRAADPLDGHRNFNAVRHQLGSRASKQQAAVSGKAKHNKQEQKPDQHWKWNRIKMKV